MDYARHKPDCGMKMVPFEQYIDDYGTMQVLNDGIVMVDKCTCGFSEMIGKIKQSMQKIEEANQFKL